MQERAIIVTLFYNNTNTNLRMDNHTDASHHEKKMSCDCGPSGGYRGHMVFWGLFLVIIGGYYFGVETGVFTDDLPFWPIVAMVFGAFGLVKGLLMKR